MDCSTNYLISFRKKVENWKCLLIIEKLNFLFWVFQQSLSGLKFFGYSRVSFSKILKIFEPTKLILIIPDWRFRKNIKMNQIQSQEWVISFLTPTLSGFSILKDSKLIIRNFPWKFGIQKGDNKSLRSKLQCNVLEKWIFENF